MARQEYELSFLTKDTLKDHVGAIAEEGGYTDKYLYSILSGAQTDPYAPFRRLFKAIARVRPEQALLYLKDLRSLIPNGTSRHSLAPLNEGLLRITQAYLALMASSGEDKKELKDRVDDLVKEGMKVQEILDPQRPNVTGDGCRLKKVS